MTPDTTTPVQQPPPRSAASDEELLLRYREIGDERDFEELVRRYERELYSYLYRYLGDAHMAEEVFQLTFFRMHERAHLFEEGRRFRPWLYSIATHLAIDSLRSAGRHRATSLDAAQATDEGEAGELIDLLPDEIATPLAQIEEEERRQWIEQAVNDLPEYLRSVVLLTYFQGLKYREAADVLGVPLGTVKSRLHQALAWLSAAWKRGDLADKE